MDILEKAEVTASIRHIPIFLNQKCQFKIPKSQTRLTEKREEEGVEKGEHRQLQSVMRLTQTNKTW